MDYEFGVVVQEVQLEGILYALRRDCHQTSTEPLSIRFWNNECIYFVENIEVLSKHKNLD